MRRFRNPVVVLGGGLTGLGALRTLGRRGLDVYVALGEGDVAIDRRQLAFSRYCKKCFVVPGLQHSLVILKSFLRRIGRSLGNRAVVYPTSDLYAIGLSKLKDELSGDFHFVVGGEEAVKTLVFKKEFYRALVRHNVSHPVTFFPESIEEARRIGAAVRYPVFLRPSMSQVFSRRFHRKGFVVRSREELLDSYGLAAGDGVDMLVQEIVPGPPWLSYEIGGYFDRSHSPVSLFARQRLRIFPSHFGNSTLTVSVPMSMLRSEKMMLCRFLGAIGYEGLMTAEFKRDPRDGILKLLEVNARCWWSMPLLPRCGVDLPFLAYLDAIGEKVESFDGYRVGVGWANLQLLLREYVLSLGLSRSVDRLRLSDLILSLRNVEEWAWFSRDDLAPFLVNCFGEGLWYLKRLRVGRSMVKMLNEKQLPPPLD